MIDTLSRTINRSAPAMSIPPVSACLMAERYPKRTKATTMDRSVSSERSFLRFRLLQTRKR